MTIGGLSRAARGAAEAVLVAALGLRVVRAGGIRFLETGFDAGGAAVREEAIVFLLDPLAPGRAFHSEHGAELADRHVEDERGIVGFGHHEYPQDRLLRRRPIVEKEAKDGDFTGFARLKILLRLALARGPQLLQRHGSEVLVGAQPLVRDRQVGMTRGWTLMHVIDEASPLHQATSRRLAELELELYIALTGIDDVQRQAVYAIHKYTDDQIRVDHHFEDTLVPLDNGEFIVDMTKFDAVVPDDRARPGT